MERVEMVDMQSTTLDIDNYLHPEPSGFSKSQIAGLAELIVKSSDGLRLREIVGTYGGTVEQTDFWGQPVGGAESLHVRTLTDFTIFVPTHTVVERDNFTIAHEFGHYILHYLWPRSKDKSKFDKPFVAYRIGSEKADKRTEWEANWFAAAMLMPRTEFCLKFEEFDGSIPLLAEKFEVTQTAAKVRAESLNLIPRAV